MSDELTTVYTATDEIEAEVVRVALEANGIASFLENAHQAGFSGVFPVKVQVGAPDVEAAKALVAEHSRSKSLDESD
ncbi:MAG: DUF2007 domain-containing protein [Planctomycetota bacterium]